MPRLNTAAQHITEFAICLAIITGAIITMQAYVQRSLQARYKDGADYVVSQIGKGKGQYHPYYQESKSVEKKDSESRSGFPVMSVDANVERSGWQYSGSAADAD